MKEIYIDNEKFKLGFYDLEDSTKAPFGTARVMKNMMVTDRGGIGPRQGTLLLGDINTNGNGIRGIYNFRKSFDENEYLIKGYDDELEVYSKNHPSAGWFRLRNVFEQSKEFGFVTSLVNTDNEDYVVYCNRYQPYSRWRGSVTQLNGARAGGETKVIVDSVLTNEIYDNRTATANSATTVDFSSAVWAASQYVNFYIYFPSTGKIRKITANTSTQLTFDTLGGAPGNIAFEIRKIAFPATGTIIYNGTEIAYTGIDVATEFTVASAHASADNVAVALVPDTYPDNPRGNRFTNYLNRIIVGNIRSAMARNSGGALQGFSSAGSYFVSKVNNPFDFTFTATRIAGEGDIVSTPYGGGDITDVANQEDSAYVFKKRYIESVKYSQDANDFAVRTPVKSEIGSVRKVIKGSDDIYFITEDKKLTSIGRISGKDFTVQTENIGYKIKRFLDKCEFDIGNGIEYNDKLYIPAKSDDTQTNNDIVIVYNKINKSFDGVWDLASYGFERFDGKLYYAESNGANVYQMLVGKADVAGLDRFPISSEYATHFMNLSSSKGTTQAMNSLYFEGYIKGNSTITFKGFKDFSQDPFLQFDFSGTEEEFLSGITSSAAIGIEPMAIAPMGSLGDVDEEGFRHFFFRVFFPFQYGNSFSIGWESSGEDISYEITRCGLGLKESVSIDNRSIKST